MTDRSLVTYALADRIATITLDDGKANVMSESMLRAIDAALDRARDDEAVVLLTGRERMFSAGYDLGMFKRDPEEILRTIRLGGRVVTRLLGFERPVVAACPGHAVAQGAFTLLAADVRFGVRGPFKFGLNEVAIGLTIPHYGVEIARLRMPAPWFHRATLTAPLLTPEQALAAGFLDELVEPDALLASARAEAARLTTIDIAAHRGTKERVRGAAIERMRASLEDPTTI